MKVKTILFSTNTPALSNHAISYYLVSFYLSPQKPLEECLKPSFSHPNIELCSVSNSSSRSLALWRFNFIRSYASSSVFNSKRHNGHELVFSSHGRMHELWNEWVQGSTLNVRSLLDSLSSSLPSSSSRLFTFKQIAHFSLEFSQPIFTTFLGKLLTMCFEAGGANSCWYSASGQNPLSRMKRIISNIWWFCVSADVTGSKPNSSK